MTDAQYKANEFMIFNLTRMNTKPVKIPNNNLHENVSYIFGSFRDFGVFEILSKKSTKKNEAQKSSIVHINLCLTFQIYEIKIVKQFHHQCENEKEKYFDEISMQNEF